MIVTGNPIFFGAKGKLQNLVVKQYAGKTVVTVVPDMSNRKLSPRQKDANDNMKLAIQSAKYFVADPRLKQRACNMLQVPPNKVFRAIVKEWLLTKGAGRIFEETTQELQDKKTLKEVKETVAEAVPDATIMLFGERAKSVYNPQCNWDLLILTDKDYSQTNKWKLQEKLLAITLPQGTAVNMLLVQKAKWYAEPEYEALRKRITGELLPIGYYTR
jgi:hypothetical protein